MQTHALRFVRRFILPISQIMYALNVMLAVHLVLALQLIALAVLMVTIAINILAVRAMQHVQNVSMEQQQTVLVVAQIDIF